MSACGLSFERVAVTVQVSGVSDLGVASFRNHCLCSLCVSGMMIPGEKVDARMCMWRLPAGAMALRVNRVYLTQVYLVSRDHTWVCLVRLGWRDD